MKSINISSIISAAEKLEKGKATLKFQAERANKIARACATAEGRAKWEAITDDFLDQIKVLDTSFYKPLDEALTDFERPYRVRNFETAKNLVAALQKVLDEINIPKKYFDGTTISIRAYAGAFPAAYKGTPTTTEATFFNKNGKWYLKGFDRVTVKNNVATCTFSVTTKEALVKRFENF